MLMAQLVFNFAASCSYRIEDFIVTNSNQEAFSSLMQWINWPHNILLLVGPQYSGKTHLSTIFQKLSSAVFTSRDNLQTYEDFFHSNSSPFILDSLKFQELEEPLLHFYNLCREKQRTLLLTAETHPIQWDIKLPDLKSRLVATRTITIQQPDDILIKGILLKRFSDLQISISDNVLEYLLTHIERSYSAIQNIVLLLDEASLAEQKKVTLPLIKRVLNL
ncbi:MAG: hypothetical protein BGO77_00745 [Caedibacter sp. 37-49]|nr:MAG: hypothetical protein BGO77_00745 [Caedibacter sp. 37-49]